MQIKTTLRYHFIPARKAKIRKIVINIDEDVEKLESSCVAGGHVKWFRHFGK